jgi:acyl-CoA thioester hydrolase
LQSTERFTAETTLHIRYAETDAMGITHHAAYIVFFEEGRSAYARQRGYPYSNVEKDGYFLTVTEINARYIKPAVYDQQITIKTQISEMKSRAMTFEYEIVSAETGEKLVTGHSKHVCVTRDGRVERIPDIWRAWGDS